MRSLRLAVVFLAFGGLLSALAVVHGGFSFLLLWPALDFLLIGAAYLLKALGMFGKTSGQLSLGSRLLFLPYFLFLWGQP